MSRSSIFEGGIKMHDRMKRNITWPVMIALFLLAICLACVPLFFILPNTASASTQAKPNQIRHVLLLSIDGLHEQDLARYTALNPNSALAQLTHLGTTYTDASTSKPSDSFPGLLSMLTGGSPRSTGVFYDDSYDRTLVPPQGACVSGKAGPGTEVLFDESIDIDLTRLDGGGGINTANLPLDPFNKCLPVFPHQYLRVNTIFEVVKKAGGYTAWSDKNFGYDIVQGPSGKGVDDLFIREIKSNIVPLPGIPSCTTVP